MHNDMMSVHQSVLLDEAVDALGIAPDDIVVDATVGGAGHFAAMLARLGAAGTIVGIDADADAIVRGRAVATDAKGTEVCLVEGNFRNLGQILDRLEITEITKSLFDLGWSSYHLQSGRGFSFRADEPLQMTYGVPVSGKTAADMVNHASEDALADLLFSLGEERFARQIARGIVRAREVAPIETTKELADIVSENVPGWYRHRRLHPATKTFQALRIAVNDELGALREGLGTAIERTREGGRIAVITFHSIEDRIVKSVFRDAVYAGKGALTTKKPVAPGAAETTLNPRARSAKLRVFERRAMPAHTNSLSSTFTYA